MKGRKGKENKKPEQAKQKVLTVLISLDPAFVFVPLMSQPEPIKDFPETVFLLRQLYRGVADGYFVPPADNAADNADFNADFKELEASLGYPAGPRQVRRYFFHTPYLLREFEERFELHRFGVPKRVESLYKALREAQQSGRVFFYARAGSPLEWRIYPAFHYQLHDWSETFALLRIRPETAKSASSGLLGVFKLNIEGKETVKEVLIPSYEEKNFPETRRRWDELAHFLSYYWEFLGKDAKNFFSTPLMEKAIKETDYFQNLIENRLASIFQAAEGKLPPMKTLLEPLKVGPAVYDPKKEQDLIVRQAVQKVAYFLKVERKIEREGDNSDKGRPLSM